jgi:hypothetical protein
MTQQVCQGALLAWKCSLKEIEWHNQASTEPVSKFLCIFQIS